MEQAALRQTAVHANARRVNNRLQPPEINRSLRFVALVMPRGKGLVTRRLHLSRMVAAAAERVLGVRGVEVARVSPTADVRVHRPRDVTEPLPAVLWIHGGGYVLGSARVGDRNARRMSDTLGAVVASVEYRLAPEHPFPAALDDCYAALEWLVAQPDIDARRIVVSGISAGGGLAAALTLRCVDTGLVKPTPGSTRSALMRPPPAETTSRDFPRHGSVSAQRIYSTTRTSITRRASRRQGCPHNSRSFPAPFMDSISPPAPGWQGLSRQLDWRRRVASSKRRVECASRNGQRQVDRAQQTRLCRNDIRHSIDHAHRRGDHRSRP